MLFGSAITWLKIIQTLQVGGVLESSGDPLEDGHRDFWNWCILGWEIDENESAILNDPNCIYNKRWPKLSIPSSNILYIHPSIDWYQRNCILMEIVKVGSVVTCDQQLWSDSEPDKWIYNQRSCKPWFLPTFNHKHKHLQIKWEIS